MIVTVIYPKEVAFAVDLNSCYVTLSEIAEQLFKTLEDNDLGVRSSMVGDIYIINNRYMIVDGDGFRDVQREQAIKWQKIEVRDRILGWDWCRSHELI